MAAASIERAGGTGDAEHDKRTAPLRVDAQRNLEHVLRAAREVFGELGYGAPMEDVARRARVGVGTVYRRFPSKDVLVRRIAAEETERLTGQAHAALAQEDDPWGALTQFLRYAVGTGAGRLLPPEVLRAGAAQVTAVTAAAKLPQQRQDSPPAEVLSGELPPAAGSGTATALQDSARQDSVLQETVLQDSVRQAAVLLDSAALGGALAGAGQGAAEQPAASSAATGLLDAVSRLVERARLVGKLRADVTVADVLLVIATAAPSLPDANQQAAASARVLEILLAGLQARPGDIGHASDPTVAATGADGGSGGTGAEPVKPPSIE